MLPFYSLAILNSLKKQKLVKWEQQEVSGKQQGADINSYTSLCERFVGPWATVLLSVALLFQITKFICKPRGENGKRRGETAMAV